MALEIFRDGIEVGVEVENYTRCPLQSFDEYFVSSVNLGTLTAGEVRTLVFNDIPTARYGSRIIASPMNPQEVPYLEIRHAWVSDANQVSVIIKNDSSSSQTPSVQDQWQLTIIDTTAP